MAPDPYNITSAVNGIFSGVPMLNDTNWFDWKKKMNMFFMGIGIDGISSGEKPTVTAELTSWTSMDKKMVAYIYMKVEDEYHYLFDEETSGAGAWKKLKDYFERSTMGQRITARQEFYEIHHDPTRPISFYVQAITSARKKMEALGCKIEDTEVKDVLLMRLDPSYNPIRTVILSKTEEPSLADVKKTLMSSGATDSVEIKQEPQDIALAARFRNQRSGVGEMGGISDGEYQWCNPASNGCHRCGRPGHVAGRCMYNMPQHVKDRLMGTTRSGSPPRHAHSANNPSHNDAPLPSQYPAAYSAITMPTNHTFSDLGPHLI